MSGGKLGGWGDAWVEGEPKRACTSRTENMIVVSDWILNITPGQGRILLDPH